MNDDSDDGLTDQCEAGLYSILKIVDFYFHETQWQNWV